VVVAYPWTTACTVGASGADAPVLIASVAARSPADSRSTSATRVSGSVATAVRNRVRWPPNRVTVVRSYRSVAYSR
jgi:hypothetical protein